MEQPPPIPTAPNTAPAEPAMPLWARLLNVFAVPGDVFEQVKSSRIAVGNWLVPMLLTGAVTAMAAIILFSQPAILQQMKEKNDEAIEKQVKGGKMSREDADKASALTEKILGPVVLKVFGGIGGLLVGFAKIFGWGLVLWLIANFFLKVRVNFMKTVEVAGLAGMIGVLGIIVTLLLQVNFSNPASSPSLALTVNFDPNNTLHLLLAALNLFDLWQLCVLSIGLARVTGVPFMRASFVVFGVWLVLMFGQLALSGLGRGLAG